MDIKQKTKYSATNAVILPQLLWAKTLAGLRFSNSLQELSTYWIFHCTSFVKALNKSCESASRFLTLSLIRKTKT